LSVTYCTIIKILENLNRYEETVEYAERAVDTARQFLGPEYHQVKENEDYLQEKL
jgi:hypothetical protein